MTLGEDIVIVRSESDKYFKEEDKSCLKRNNNENNSNFLRDKRKEKKRSSKPVIGVSFADLYKLTGETLGEGSYGIVETCKNVFTGKHHPDD